MAKKKLSTEQIKLIADSIMSDFIPKDKTEEVFEFYFTAEGGNYKVKYKKVVSDWIIQTIEEVTE